MGVHGLWQILACTGQQCVLSELRGLRLAVDLSGWVCESCQAKGLAMAIHKPHLRNLFFRLIHLCVEEEVELLFVIDGYADPMKWKTMDHRMGGAGVIWGGRRTGVRHRLNQKLRECCELLEAVGIPYIQSNGEAESLCALLNKEGVVDGVISDDSDALLYGAKVVYKQLTTDRGNKTQVVKFSMERVTQELGLTRRDLIVMAVLLGCDYLPQGLPGIGKAIALKAVAENKELFEVFKTGGEGGDIDDDMTKLSQKIFEKAKQTPHFFENAINVIKEFMETKESLPEDLKPLKTWRQPNVIALQNFLEKKLEWSSSYAVEKAAILLAHWVLREKERGLDARDIQPVRIEGQKIRKGVCRYMVEWTASTPLPDVDLPWQFTTLEKANVIQLYYPEVYMKYKEEEETKKAERKKKKKENRKDICSSKVQSMLETDMLQCIDKRSENENGNTTLKLIASSIESVHHDSVRTTSTNITISPLHSEFPTIQPANGRDSITSLDQTKLISSPTVPCIESVHRASVSTISTNITISPEFPIIEPAYSKSRDSTTSLDQPKLVSSPTPSSPVKSNHSSPLGKRGEQKGIMLTSPSKKLNLEIEKDVNTKIIRKISFPEVTTFEKANEKNKEEFTLDSDEEVLPLMERLKMSSPLKHHRSYDFKPIKSCKKILGSSDECPIILD